VASDRARSGRRLPLGAGGPVPLGFQVLAGIGGLLAMVVASVVVGILLADRLAAHEAKLNDRDVPYAAALASAALSAKGIANDERGFLLTGNAKFIDELDDRVTAARAAFGNAQSAASSPARARAARDARRGFERWISAVRQEFAAYADGERQASIGLALGPDRALRKRYEASLAAAQTSAASTIASGRSSVAAASARLVTILLACLFAAFVFGVALGFWLVRTILRPVYTLLRLFGEVGRAQSRA
jgi:methyl-accepting chemotaxis protein